jgi:glycosyltransferase involved in cell wall biosynthesis
MYFAEFEILLVDDGSTDDTWAEALSASQNSRHIRPLRHLQNQGYGAALRTGFLAARWDRIAFTDADRQFDLSELAMLTDATEIVGLAVGYRADRQDPWRRRFLSKGYNWLARRWLGTRVRDCDCALKVFRREALDQIMPTSKGFFVNTEMLSRAARLNLSLAEFPVTHRPRAHGTSKVSLWEIPRTLLTMFRYWRASRQEVISSRVFAARISATPRPASRLPVSSGVGSPVVAPAPHRESA